MENNINKTKVTLIVLLILSLLFSGWLIVRNKSARIEAAKEKSVLVTEKQMLMQNINELATEKQKLSTDQKKQIDELLKDVETKNNELQRLLTDNAKVKDLRKKLKELEQVKNELKTVIENLKGNLDNANKSNAGLEAEVQALKVENDRINTELMFAKSLHSNDFLIEGIKRNQKITAWARRTKEINLSFDFPENHIEELEASILTPDGKTYTSADKDLVCIKTSKEAAAIYPSGLKAKRMELSLNPEKKFVKGIYKFTIFKGTDVVATMQIQLK